MQKIIKDVTDLVPYFISLSSMENQVSFLLKNDFKL